MGYRDPEYDLYLRLTDRTDVYSFGVVLMELITGQLAVDVNRDLEDIYLDKMSLNKILTKHLDEFVDPRLFYQSNKDVKSMIYSVAELAGKCLQPKGEIRPQMLQVLAALKGIQNEMQQVGLNDVHVISFGPPQELYDYRGNNDIYTLKTVTKVRWADLVVACEDFSNILSSSSETMVFKGTMKEGSEIAVISICVSQKQWTNYLENLFRAQVADLARLNHEGTSKLLGYNSESSPFSRMLVFEYVSNGTLYQHLHRLPYGDDEQLSWFSRMNIAIDIARALRYLHTELWPPFTIFDLSSMVVFLTEDLTPKLVDFERWEIICSRLKTRLKNNSGNFTRKDSVHGLMGSLEQRRNDVQANTYSFGVLLLEMISGRPPNCKERGCLVTWAMGYLQLPEELGKLVDPALKDVKADDLSVICRVVGLCLESNPFKRPSMQIICGLLENRID